MDEASPIYNAAQALRSGGTAPVRQALLEVRERTLALAGAYSAALADSGLQIPYAPELNPPLWELGHIAWFQEWWISRNRQRSLGVRCDPGHERPPSLVAPADRWYDSSRVEHRSRWTLPLPGEKATRDYLAATLAETLALLAALPAQASHDELYFFRLVAVHEAMHGEAAVYMARTLGIQLPRPQAVRQQEGRTAAPMVIQVPAQVFRLGSESPGFAFDNELRAHEVEVGAFQIDAQPVNWGRFMDFVENGGYARRQWWSAEGWAWLQQHGGRRTPPPGLEPDAPALHRSAHEAQAWCSWAGRRLPTEAQWECAALTAPGFAWGRVWEWTASSFLPYPGFEPHPYRDYSAPWFGLRTVLRGACDATSPWLAHPRYRNFFEPHRSDIFAGFRSCA